MKASRYSSCIKNKKKMDTINVQRSQNPLQRLYNWKMSFNVIDTGQQNIIFSQKSSFTFCPCSRYQLKECTCIAQREIRISDAESEEYEARLDHSDSMLDSTKLNVWDEYKKLLLSKSTYRPQKDLQSLLAEMTCFRKIRVDKPLVRSQPRPSGPAKRSIMRLDFQKTILLANSNYIQFRNFKLHKLYKKTIRLQNITTSPAKFRIQGRPYHSYFQVLIKPIVENSTIIPPGMVMKLIVSFYCNVIDEPEEILVLNVQDGKPVNIRLHGFRDPPILRCYERYLPDEELDNAGNIRKSSIASHQELGCYPDEAMSTDSTTSGGDSEDWAHTTYRNVSFDCKKSFVGEKVRVSMKFKNIGGEGRFFVMSEIDWSSMYIEDITEENLLRIPPFAIWPAYFELKSQEEIILWMYFLPDSYGIHVDKLYVLSNNCTMLATEIFGDGVLYEPDFIQLTSKASTSSLRNSTVDIVQVKKDWPSNEHTDKRARYYVNLKASDLDGIGQCTVCVSNISEISMNFRWKKRATRVDETDRKNYNNLPLHLLEVYPEHGVLSPISEHYFNVTAASKDLRLNLYSAVLQSDNGFPSYPVSQARLEQLLSGRCPVFLPEFWTGIYARISSDFCSRQAWQTGLYVEDIPLAAISQKLELHTEPCTNRQRKALSSVDVWVAGIEVRLQCDIDDDSRIDTEVSETFESLDVSTSSYECCGWDIEDTREVCCETIKHSCLCKLMREELFSHYDRLNLKQFEPLLWEHIISVATIRPTRALYIGIEETYVLLARNFSDKSVKFSWGEANGADAETLKLCVCPQNGVVTAKNTKIMKITVVPVKEGIVQFLHIPCFINDTRKIIMLTIECFIEPLHVAFYFPQNDREVSQWKTSFTRVEWRVDNSRMDFDMADECKKGMKLLDKYKMQEELELMNMNLDQGDILKDASMGTSATNVGAVESREESSLSTRTSEIIKIDNFTTEEGNYTEENEFSGYMVPFSETTLPSSIQPVVIEFSNVPLRKVEKKTFIIKNGTAIPTNFWISVKNFSPVQCSCERQIIEDRIKFMFQQAFGKNKNIVAESLYRAKQPDSGIIIHVDPLSFNLDPFAAVPVDIYVFADTWGIYIDELEISITGLPRYKLAICVQVVGLPISLSIAQTSSTAVPVLNYGLEPMGSRLLSRTVLIKNTSVIPIAINWHVFLIKPILTEKIPPINIIYDICTPFTNELSKELKNSRLQSNTETPMKNHVTVDRKSKIPNTHDFISINDTVVDTLKTPSDISDQRYVKTEAISTCPLRDEERHDSEKAKQSTIIQRILAYFRCRQIYEKDDTNSYIDAEQNEMEKKEKEDIECRISVLPYYGEINNNVCTVTPKEMFTMPNHSAAIRINIYPEKCVSNGNFEGEFVCKVLGFLRIAPSDKHQDNQYCRLDGLYLSPIEFDVAITVVQPLLLYDIPRANKTFICCINDVMNTKSKKLELSKSFFFYNNKGTAINVILETYYPFHIKSTSIFTECEPHIPMLGVSIHGHGCAEVEIICKVDHQLLHTILHTRRAQELRSSTITLKEPLFIVYPDNSTQELELNLQIWIPSLKLSTYTLDFNTVYVNEIKKLTLVLENLSMSVYQFKVKGKHNNKDFAVDQNEGKLLSKHAGSCYYTLTISFQPKKPGQSVETLEIITYTPYNVEECELIGEGTLDEKFHNPGV